MSTRTSFDLTGLRRAIESCDSHYQLALYADDAEVEVMDAEDTASPWRVLHGREAIGAWIDTLSPDTGSWRVVDPAATENRISFTEQCRHPDQTETDYVCSAEVWGGQIIKETVTVTHQRMPAGVVRRARTDQPSTGVDQQPSNGPAPSFRPPRMPATTWSLAGNYLG